MKIRRPDLFQQLLQILRASASPDAYRLRLPRALLVVLYIVKELSTGRLLRTRQNLQSVAPEVLNVLGTIYVSKVQTWQTFLQNAIKDLSPSLDIDFGVVQPSYQYHGLTLYVYHHPSPCVQYTYLTCRLAADGFPSILSRIRYGHTLLI